MTFYSPVANADVAVESSIARDLARKALIAAPGVVLLAGLIKGGPGALGALAALAVVALNFMVAAAALGRAARISAGALMATALLSFVVRLGVIVVIGLGVKQIDAVHFPTFCVVLVVAHLGLLFWELRHVSLTLTYPGLKPSKKETSL